MTSKSHSVYTVGYNVQSAVDTKHHLIVTHDVTNVGIDKGQLSHMAEQVRDALPENRTEVPLEHSRDSFGANVKHTYYYLFQKQGLVANKDQLFYRQSEQFQPQAIRDTLPILLGVSSHDRYELESKLRIAQRDLRISNKKLEQARDAVDTSHEQGISLYSEAKAVGVIGNTGENPSAEPIILKLRSALSWNPETLPDDDGSRISLLEDELARLRQDRRDSQARIDAARQFAKRAGGYESEAAEQIERCASIKALPKNPENGEWQWPFSERNLALESPVAVVLRNELESLENELRIVALCRNMHLLDEGLVAIDGSKFKAVNNREKNFTHDRLKKRMQSIEEAGGRYLADLDLADRQAEVSGVPVPVSKVTALKDRVEGLKAKIQTLSALEAKLVASGEKQISLTDPDARAMTTKSHSAYTVGYNVQSAVDTKNHLIVAHEVTNIGIDTGQLSSMAAEARDALKSGGVEVLADKGYYKSEEIAACEDAGIAVYVPKPITSNARAEGRFDKRDFLYDPINDHYRCPAGQHLTYRMTREESGRVMQTYFTNACETCPLRSDCTTGKERRVKRWEREHLLERVQERLDRTPGAMQVRRETIEHTFGTIKAWMGATHFKMKTLKHVGTEMALHVLAYNIKRVIAILGVPKLIKTIAAFLLWILSFGATSWTPKRPV